MDGEKVDLSTYTVPKGLGMLFARWENNTKHTITFDPNGGEIISDFSTVEVYNGDLISKSPTVSKVSESALYDFDGWYTEAEGGEKIDISVYKPARSMTLYAHWKETEAPEMPVTKISGGYRIEAEDCQMVKGNPTDTKNWVENTPAASGGKSLGYLNNTGNKFIFAFNSSAAGTAEIKLWLSSAQKGTGNGSVDQQFGPDKMEAIFNGEAVSFEEQTVVGCNNDGWNKQFSEFTLGNVNVNKDVNVLILTVKDHWQQMPNFDCIDIVTSDLGLSSTGSEPPVIDKPTMPVTSVEGGYRIEAEDCFFEGEKASNAQEGQDIYENADAASGGECLGFLDRAGNKLTFTFNSDKAATVTLNLGMASNKTNSTWSGAEDQQISNDKFSVTVNGTDAPFSEQTVVGSPDGQGWNKVFSDVVIENVNIVEGYNVITITVKDFNLPMPNCDYLDIITDAVLTAVTE